MLASVGGHFDFCFCAIRPTCLVTVLPSLTSFTLTVQCNSEHIFCIQDDHPIVPALPERASTGDLPLWVILCPESFAHALEWVAEIKDPRFVPACSHVSYGFAFGGFLRTDFYKMPSLPCPTVLLQTARRERYSPVILVPCPAVSSTE